MKTYPSNQALFAATRAVAETIESEGLPQAATELLESLSAINGLTDGWAQFLESIDSVCVSHAGRLGQTALSELQAIRKAVAASVFR